MLLIRANKNNFLAFEDILRMKTIKCYGRKTTKILERSIVKAFFEGSNPLVNWTHVSPDRGKSCCNSNEPDVKDKLKVNNSKEVSLFYSFIKEPVQQKLFKKKTTRNTFKTKALPRKLHRYKGKRKFKKAIKKSHKLKEKIPSFSSIAEHDLAVENGKTRLVYSSNLRDHSSHSPINSSNGILQDVSLAQQHSNSFSPIYQPDTVAVEISDILLSNENKKSKTENEIISPISAKYKMLDRAKDTDIIENSFVNQNNCKKYNQAPITSTPVTQAKHRYSENLHLSNLSAISVDYRKNKRRKTIMEFSFRLQTLKSGKHMNKSLSNKDFWQERVETELSLSRKSYSNVEKSRFIKSHSCLNEVSKEHNEQGSILSMLLELCNQNEIISFSDVYNWEKATLRKVGEGSYGEVFMITRNKQSLILKVIPVSEEFENNLQSMESVYSEIKVSYVLSELRQNKNFQTKNFNLLKGVYVVQGNYPAKLLGAWDTYSNTKTTYNYRPDVFDDQQIFVILELEYGGKDMSFFVLRNAVEAESILKQIAISLAIAEEAHLFEHRDLHLGNILVQRTKSKKVTYIFRGKSVSIPSEGVFVTIIDFTLSRVLHEGCVYYNDLADDESLFNQSGDFQFEVYRATKQKLKNQWHECLLYSNVLWLNFLCKNLLEHDYCRGSSVKHNKSLQSIRTFSSNLELCKSASDCLEICKIIYPFPEKIMDQDSKLSYQTLFIDRKSLQKSSHLSNL